MLSAVGDCATHLARAREGAFFVNNSASKSGTKTSDLFVPVLWQDKKVLSKSAGSEKITNFVALIAMITMKRQKCKERFERLRQWQMNPFVYEFESNEEHLCNNCGHTFTGNYCPYCSQKAGEGHIGWGSVRQSVMDIWGLGSHSLPNTVLQLLVRPGYLISDYISGKRQVCFPPVKMLFIVAVIVVFWVYYLMPYFLGDFDVYGGATNMISGFDTWVKGHFVWTYFVLALFYVMPTWVLFRYSPRHTHHTLPQGFFVQFFLLVLNLILSFILLSPLAIWSYKIYLGVSVLVLLAYFTYAYKQLFGYGVWGSLWRMLFIFGSSSFVIASLVFLLFDIDFSAFGNGLSPFEYNKYYLAGQLAFHAFFILLIGWCINLIATKISRYRKAKGQKSLSKQQ